MKSSQFFGQVPNLADIDWSHSDGTPGVLPLRGRSRSSSDMPRAKRAASTSRSAKRPKNRSSWKKGQRFNGLNNMRLRNDSITGSLFPTNAWVKLKYCQTNQPLALVGGVPTKRQYRLNGLFDPDLTGVGHQPYEYDQLMALGIGYQKAMVHAAKYKVIPEQRSLVAGMKNWYLTVEHNQGGVTDANACETGLERANKWLFVPVQPVDNAGAATASMEAQNEPRMIKNFVRLKDLLGRKLDPSTDSADWNGNPTQAMLLNVFAWDPANAVSATYSYTIMITYYCQLFDWTQPVNS